MSVYQYAQSGPRSASPPETLLTLRQVRQALNLSANTLRRMSDDGRIQCVVLPTGHRRWKTSEITRLINGGKSEEGIGGAKSRIALLSRVSTPSQLADLAKQKQRLTEYAAERWPDGEITHFSRQASGLNYTNKVFLAFVRQLIAGRFDYVVATFKDRIIRQGFDLILSLAEFGGAEVVLIESQEDVSSEQELCEDILSLCAIANGKKMGKRAAKYLSHNPSPDSLNRIYQLWAANHSARYIAQVLVKENLDRDSSGRPISKHVVARIIRQNKKGWGKLRDNPTDIPSSLNPSTDNTFAVFIQEHLRVAATLDHKISQKALLAAFLRWHTQTYPANVIPPNPHQCRLLLRSFVQSHKPDCQKVHDDNGSIAYRGLALAGLNGL